MSRILFDAFDGAPTAPSPTPTIIVVAGDITADVSASLIVAHVEQVAIAISVAGDITADIRASLTINGGIASGVQFIIPDAGYPNVAKFTHNT